MNDRQVNAHLTNASAILRILATHPLKSPARKAMRERLERIRPLLDEYQLFLIDRFGDTILKPSFEYIDKTDEGWLIVGDHRAEIASDIRLIVERHGIGIGALVLHLQQILAGHIPLTIEADGRTFDLTAPTGRLAGLRGESVLSIPVRQFRSDFAKLAAMSIVKTKQLCDPANLVTHERDGQICNYCSCRELNPAEVAVDLDGFRHGLSRNYSIGFTFAPFGNPLKTVHFLAWDRAPNPLNMNRTPMTVSDLVKLTREMNLSIRTFFAETSVKHAPVLDGVSNGWAGNTIFHQHFQFFCPEFATPIAEAKPVSHGPVVARDDATVERLEWPTPVYRIVAAEALNTGLIGNDLAGIWRLLGGTRKALYKKFHDGYLPADGEKVPAHTQNVYVTGQDLGRKAYMIPRDRDRIDFKPGVNEFVNATAGRLTQRKENIGVLEVTGSLIVDDLKTFDAMQSWDAADISRQIELMIGVVAPPADKTAEFESAVAELFPQ